ncbi:MAG TPA: hypothetical protein VIT92_16655 [Burkholderiaceae bacterium]
MKLTDLIIPPWVKWAAMAAVLAGLYLAWQDYERQIYNEGFSARDIIAKQEADRQQADFATRLAAKSEQYRALELRMSTELGAQAARFAQEKANADEKTTALRADVRNLTLRLSIPVRTPATAGPGAAAGSTAGAAPDSETRAELMPEAAIALIDIVADGDSAVRERNECVAQYETVRRMINLQPKR